MEHEADLIRHILLGHPESFEPIVLEYQNLVFSICVNILKNTHDAENVAQETFLAAFNSLPEYRGGNLKSWLCRIAANKSIDYKRRQARFVPDGFVEPAVQAGHSLEETVELQERKEKLEHILSAMPGKYAAVIKAFYYSQLTVKEIARRMELPERTVETQLYRAKKLIRERWGEHGG